jgi:Fe-S-cluster-containing hydrogenase component 2
MWFKIIAGASHTDLDRVVEVASAFGNLPIDCLDIAADTRIIDAVHHIWRHINQKPLLMVSLAVDEDLHFRKIALDRDACIDCGACVPVCPADALAMAGHQLMLDLPRCYGCDRCLPVCPTNALTLHPYMPPDVAAALNHPAVQAVELHTRFAQVDTMANFMAAHGHRLDNKLISVCFSPQQTTDWWPLILWMLEHRHTYQWMLQIDGKPMSGTPEPDASLPALSGAQMVYSQWRTHFPGQPFPFRLTISGGVNTHTVNYMAQDAFSFVDGVAIGTVARQWLQLGHSPKALVQLFKPHLTRINRSFSYA